MQGTQFYALYCVLCFYQWSLDVELWVFRWTFSFPLSPQLLLRKEGEVGGNKGVVGRMRAELPLCVHVMTFTVYFFMFYVLYYAHYDTMTLCTL